VSGLPSSSRIQRPYWRNGPDHRSGADVSFLDIVKIFDFQRIKVGRWVTSAEQQLAANLFFDALCDLQTVLQVPTQVISLNGSLALSFGTGGSRGTCAFYQPQGRVLALAKNAGGGSLAHEWPAFDHYIASRMFKSATATQFASRLWLQNQVAVKECMHVHPLNDWLSAAFADIFLDGAQPSAFFLRAKAFDAKSQRRYYALPEEMAARSFEQVLQRLPLQNHFLVDGTLAGPAFDAGLYPETTRAERLACYWLSYFQQLGQALQLKRE